MSSYVAGKASSVSKGLQNICVIQGEDAVFTCEVTQASFAVKWAKDGKAIKKSQKYELSQQDRVMKLTIHNVSAQDSGEYSCEVIGGATTRAKLEIKGKTLRKRKNCLGLISQFSFDGIRLFYVVFRFSTHKQINTTHIRKVTQRCLWVSPSGSST